MSYTHVHLPELNDLKELLLKNPETIKYYAKYGALIGSNESVEYINKKIDEFYKNKTGNQRI